MSSMEAECRSMCMGAQEAMLVQNIARELGSEHKIVMQTDSMSALNSAQRRGVLHVKHMALRLLFLKELVEKGAISIMRVEPQKSAADWLTKPVSLTDFLRCLHSLRGLQRGE